jgi:hypothetical protein
MPILPIASPLNLPPLPRLPDILGNVSAGVAQLVEQLICNQPVAGSNPVTSFVKNRFC